MILLNFFLSLQIIITLFIFLVDNLIYSVILLISILLNASVLLFMLKMDFLAFIFIIIYAGAIAILFLFIIMIRPSSILKKCIIFFGILFAFLNQIFYFIYNRKLKVTFCNLHSFFDINNNFINFSQNSYSFDNSSFLIAGLVLSVIMAETIMFTLNFNLTKTNQMVEQEVGFLISYIYFLNAIIFISIAILLLFLGID
jgi:NADH:ubiquinone oxidoreductase subunit 6 (subunit J)